MKRIVIFFFAFVIFVVGALLVAPGFIDWSIYRTEIESISKNMTGHRLEVAGDISFALLPSPRLEVSNVILYPESGDEAFLKFDKASINMAVGPLLDGEAKFEKISIVSPHLIIRVDENGRYNWMTGRLEEMLSGKGNEEENKSDEGNISSGFGAVSFDQISVDDGYVLFEDKRSGKTFEVTNINVDLKGDSVMGPYQADGSLEYLQKQFDFSAATGRVDTLDSIAVKLDVSIPSMRVDTSFAGVLAVGENPEIQVNAGAVIANLADVVDLPMLTKNTGQSKFSMLGMITASKKSVSITDVQISLEDTSFSGKARVSGFDIGKPDITASFSADDVFNFDDIFLFESSSSNSGKDKNKASLLPETLHMPFMVDGKVSLFAPKLIAGGKEFSNVNVELSKNGKKSDMSVDVAGGPGDALVEANAVLDFASESSAESGGVVYSDPVLDLKMRLVSKNIAGMVTPFLPEEFSRMAALRLFDEIDASFIAEVVPGSVSLKDNVIKLDDTVFGISGSYHPAVANGARDDVVINIAADSFDIDKLLGRMSQTAQADDVANGSDKKIDIAEAVKNFSLPVNAKFDLGAQKIIYNDVQIGGVRVTGDVNGSAFNLENLSVSDFFNGQLSAKGSIADTTRLQGIDFAVSGKAQSMEEILNALKIDIQSLPRPFGSLVLSADVEGNAQAFDFKASVEALKGKADASGQLTNLLDKPKVNSLTVSLKHPNFVDAVKIINPEFKASSGLAKSVDLYAEIKREGDNYNLSGLKANLGSMPIMGDVNVVTGDGVPSIKGALRFGTVSLGDLLGSGKRSGSSKSSSGSGDNVRWSRNAIDTEWMHKFDMDLSLEANSVSYDKWIFSSPVTSLKLSNGVLNVPNLKAGLFGGNMNFEGELRSAKDPRSPLQMFGKVKLNDVSAASFVTAFAGNQIIRAEGDVDINSEFKSSGISPAALILDLSGNGDLYSKDFVLQGVDFSSFAKSLSSSSKPGDTIAGIWGSASRGGHTGFDTIEGKFTIEAGVININPLLMNGEDVKINSTGNVNLPLWTILLNNNISFKEDSDIPAFDVKIEGDLNDPANTFAKGLLDDYLKRKLSRKLEETLGNEIGGEFGETLNKVLGNGNSSDGSKGSGSIDTEDVLKGVLKGLSK